MDVSEHGIPPYSKVVWLSALLRSEREDAFAQSAQLLGRRCSAIHNRVERRGQGYCPAAACTQHSDAKEPVDRGWLVHPAIRHVRRHVGTVRLYGPKSAPFRGICHDLTHSGVLENEHIWIQDADRIDARVAGGVAALRSQQLPAEQCEDFTGARAGYGQVEAVRSSTVDDARSCT